MFTLLGIGGTAVAAIIIGVLILIVLAFGVVKKFFPEKPRKPLKKI
jgi:hypothetical protein